MVSFTKLTGLNIKFIFDKEIVIFGLRNDLKAAIKNYINHAILIGKVVISKFRYGKALNSKVMFENEVKLRKLE